MQIYILTNLYETMLQQGNCSKLVLSCHSLSYSITFVMEFKPSTGYASNSKQRQAEERRVGTLEEERLHTLRES
jgi:hypothetical protein